jgi:hypothetical protein
VTAAVAGLGNVEQAAARPGEVHTGMLPAGWNGSMCTPSRTHLRPPEMRVRWHVVRHSCCPSPTKADKMVELAQLTCTKRKYSELEFS